MREVIGESRRVYDALNYNKTTAGSLLLALSRWISKLRRYYRKS